MTRKEAHLRRAPPAAPGGANEQTVEKRGS
jgi:hypothetical protein